MEKSIEMTALRYAGDVLWFIGEPCFPSRQRLPSKLHVGGLPVDEKIINVRVLEMVRAPEMFVLISG